MFVYYIILHYEFLSVFFFNFDAYVRNWNIEWAILKSDVILMQAQKNETH